MVYYDRKMECVVGGEEGEDYGPPKNRSDLNNTVIDTKLEKKPLPFKELKNVWGDDMDDLDKIFQGGTVLLGSRDGNSNLRTPQQPGKDLPSPGKTVTGSPSSGFVSVSSAESDTGSISARSPPPLRLPVLTNSDLLRRLVKATEAKLTERGRDGEERTLDGEPGGPLPDGHRPDTVGEHLQDGPGQAAPSHRNTVTGLGLQQTRQDLAPLQLRH